MDFSACLVALGCCLFGAYLLGAYQVGKILWFIFHLPTFRHYQKMLAAESADKFGRFLNWVTYILVGWGWNLTWCGVIFTKHILLGRGDMVTQIFARQLFSSIATRTYPTSLEVLEMVLKDLKMVEERFPHLSPPETRSSPR